MTLKEAAERLGVTAATLRQQIANGRLRAKKVGRDWTISKREVERYAREQSRRNRDRQSIATTFGVPIDFLPSHPVGLEDQGAVPTEAWVKWFKDTKRGR